MLTVKKYLIILIAFSLLGTAQSYFSLYHLITQDGGAYTHYDSIIDVLFDYCIHTVILALFCLLLKKTKYIVWLFIILYTLLFWFQINISIFYDLESSWSTYSISELYSTTFWYSLWPFTVCFALFCCVLYLIYKKYSQ